MFVGTEFTGRWQQADSKDADNVMSQTVFVIMYMNCPVFCKASYKQRSLWAQ